MFSLEDHFYMAEVRQLLLARVNDVLCCLADDFALSNTHYAVPA